LGYVHVLVYWHNIIIRIISYNFYVSLWDGAVDTVGFSAWYLFKGNKR